MVRRLLPCLLLALGLPASALAAPITFQFEGVVTQVVDPGTFDGSVLPGTPFSGAYTFDTEAVGIPSFPGSPGLLYPASEFVVTLGNYQIRSLDSDLDATVGVSNDPDSYGAGSRNNDVDGDFAFVPPELVDVIISPSVRVGWSISGAEVFSSTELPLTPPDASAWPVSYFEIVADIGRVEPAFTITGRITSIVPEPGSALLLGSALLALRAFPRPHTWRGGRR